MKYNFIPARFSVTVTGLITTLLILTLISCGPLPGKDDAIKQNQKGIDYMNAGKYELALQEFTEAIRNPNLTNISKGTIYRNMALTYHELNNNDSSVHYYTIAAKTYRKNSYDYILNMASVDMLTGKTNIALAKLTKAVTLNPDDLSVNNTLGLIYLGDYGEQFADAEKAFLYNKKAFDISGGRITEDILGRNYYELKHYELAEMHYENVHNQYPAVLTYTLNLGMIKYKLNKKPEGDAFFKKVLAQDSSYKETIETFKINNR